MKRRWRKGNVGGGRGGSGVGKTTYGGDDGEEAVKAAEMARIREGHSRSGWLWEENASQKEGDDGKPSFQVMEKTKKGKESAREA